MKKQTVFMTYIESFYKLVLPCKNLRSRNLRQRSDGPTDILVKLHRKDMSSAIFGKFTDNESCLF